MVSNTLYKYVLDTHNIGGGPFGQSFLWTDMSTVLMHFSEIKNEYKCIANRVVNTETFIE